MENMDNQEEVSKSTESKTKRKGHGPVYWLIVIVGVTFIIAASFNIGTKVGKIAEGDVSTGSSKKDESSNKVESNSNEASNITSNESATPKEVSQETLNYLLDILGINNNGWIQLTIYKVQGVVNEKLSVTQKHMLSYLYADDHKMLTDISGTEYSYCANGNCKGILKTDFAKIAKLYGITDDPVTMFKKEEIYKDYYLYTPGIGGVSSAKQTNVKASYSGNDIIVTTDLTVDTAGEITDKKAMTYTFKLNNENNYYLYSVASK